MKALGKFGYKPAIPLTYSVAERISLWFGSEEIILSSEMDVAGTNTSTLVSKRIHAHKRMMKTAS